MSLLPYKHHNLPLDVFCVAWMRDPIERLASHYYYYWRNTYNKNQTFSLQKKFPNSIA